MRTRKDAMKMATWDPTLVWYEKAVAVMKNTPMDQPTSWKYQAAIHGFPLVPNSLGKHAQKMWNQWAQNEPQPPEKNQVWDKCQHQTWYFLPWHRMYLGYFEKIVVNIIVGLGGPADWALPYWNYVTGPNRLSMPAAFWQPLNPAGTPNQLLEPSRRFNSGAPILTALKIDIGTAFDEAVFQGGSNGVPPGFGGPVTYVQHFGQTNGALEYQPHNQVHDEVGGIMGDPGTAGFDPIFYLHHANIDRLWEAWLKTGPVNPDDPPHANPTAPAWLTPNVPLEFNDGTGTIVSLGPKDVLATTAAPFYYDYDDLSVPSPSAPLPSGPTPTPSAAQTFSLQAGLPHPIAELAGASSQALSLSGEPAAMPMRLFPVSGPARRLLHTEGHFRRAYLRIENVRGEGMPASYAVYLNVPEGRNPKDYAKLYVGSLPMFGLEQASLANERHPGNGLDFSLNVTNTVNFLQSENLWNPELMRVSFVPERETIAGSKLEIGRVSFYLM